MVLHARVVSALRVAVCFLAAITFCASGDCAGVLVSREVASAIELPDGSEARITVALAETVRLPWVWIRDTAYSGGGRSRSSVALPVYLNTSAKVDRLASLRLRGLMMTVGGRRVLVATEAAEYIGKNDKAVPPPPFDMAQSWQSFRPLPISLSASLTESPPTPPEQDDGDPPARDFVLNEDTVAWAKQQDDEDPVALEDVLVVACFDGDGDVPGFFYAQDINPDPTSSIQIPCGIKVVPDEEGVVESLRPGDIVDIEGALVASSSTVAEAYIDATDVTDTETDGDVPSYVAMPQRSFAGGGFGAQQATYLQTPGLTPQAGSGLNPIGTLARACGRIQWIEMTHEGELTDPEHPRERHVVYWIDDGSGLQRTVIDNTEPVAIGSEPVVRTGLKVIAWADSTTPVRHLNDYVNFAGVIGAEFSEDDTPRPVPVLLCGRRGARQVIRVNPDTEGADDANDGLSWENPKATVQGGINAAGVGGEVWVKCTLTAYTPRDGEDNVAAMRNGVSLLAGFLGTEEYRYQRLHVINGATLGYAPEGHVVLLQDLTVMARVDGFEIMMGAGGYEVGVGVVAGGGVMCTNSEGIVSGNYIHGNGCNGNGYTCETGGGIAGYRSPCLVYGNVIAWNSADPSWYKGGGGIYWCDYVPGDYVPYIAKNWIHDNWGVYGGGIGAYNCALVIRDNDIHDNSALRGGGIDLYRAGGLVLHNQIQQNGLDSEAFEYDAESGGGILYQTEYSILAPDGVPVLIADNALVGNYASLDGGGVSLWAKGAEIVHNTFSSNTCGAVDYGEGGAVALRVNGIKLSRNTFNSNTAVDRGGAVAISNCDGTVLTNNLFAGNHAGGLGGGAIYHRRDSAGADPYPPHTTTVVNNTFSGNTALNGSGGAVLAEGYSEYGTVAFTLVNNIFWKNKGFDWEDSSSTGNSVFCDWYSSAVIFYSCGLSEMAAAAAYHYYGATPGAGCYCGLIGAYDLPMFVDGCHLSNLGPWYTPIDLGHDCGVSPYDLVPLDDLDGLARPSGTCTDMGAYETQ